MSLIIKMQLNQVKNKQYEKLQELRELIDSYTDYFPEELNPVTVKDVDLIQRCLMSLDLNMKSSDLPVDLTPNTSYNSTQVTNNSEDGDISGEEDDMDLNKKSSDLPVDLTQNISYNSTQVTDNSEYEDSSGEEDDGLEEDESIEVQDISEGEQKKAEKLNTVRITNLPLSLNGDKNLFAKLGLQKVFEQACSVRRIEAYKSEYHLSYGSEKIAKKVIRGLRAWISRNKYGFQKVRFDILTPDKYSDERKLLQLFGLKLKKEKQIKSFSFSVEDTQLILVTHGHGDKPHVVREWCWCAAAGHIMPFTFNNQS